MSAKSSPESNINEVFNKRSILITGATGPIGKLLSYKILTSIGSVKNIYLIIRSKDGKSVSERFDYFVNKSHKLFDNVDKDLIKKLIPIEGDITVKGLGLSEEDRKAITDNVSVVFHCAADFVYNSYLWRQVVTNVGGTKEVIDLCRDLKKLDAFIHISSVYSYPAELVTEEKIYKSHFDPIEFLEIAKQSQVNFRDDDYIGKFPNTFTFTKNLSEKLVQQEFDRKGLPSAIVRLGFVASSYKEPFTGWFESLNSNTTKNLLAASGLVRVSKANPDVTGDIVPVDYAANACIAAAWNTITKYQTELRIYNCNSSALGAPKIGKTHDEMFELMNKYPILTTVRPMTKVVQKSHIIPIFLIQFFSETCFSYLLDFLLLIIGKKRFVVRMMEINQQIREGDECFVCRQWRFTNNNYKKLTKELFGNDKTTFDCDVRKIDWSKYHKESYFMGRKLLLREADHDIHKAQEFVKYLKILYTFINRFIIYLIIRLFLEYTPIEMWIKSSLYVLGFDAMKYDFLNISLFLLLTSTLVNSVLHYTSN